MSEFNYSQEELLKLNEAIMILKDNCRSFRSNCAGCPFDCGTGCRLHEDYAENWKDVI